MFDLMRVICDSRLGAIVLNERRLPWPRHFRLRSGWSGERRIDTASAVRIENKIVAGLALHKIEELRVGFIKSHYRFDPKVLAVWETTKNIEFVVHGPSPLGISVTY